MQWILSIIDTYSLTFIFVGIIMNILLILLLIINYHITSDLKDRYKRLVRGTSGKNIEGILMDHIAKVEEKEEGFKELHSRLDILENQLSFSIQKIGFVRYNAFEDVGSDLSFSIAMLDNNDNGILLTGIHSRTDSVSYAKPIKGGQSNYNLSIEETQALERAKFNDLDGVNIKGTRNNKNNN